MKKKKCLARGPDEPHLQVSKAWPAGRMITNLARGPNFLLYLCTLVRPAGQPNI